MPDIYKEQKTEKIKHMCQTKAEGGQRCDYADTLANVRHKARYKWRENYSMERYAREAVEEWKRQNPETVIEHLPATANFQLAGGREPIPEDVKALLSTSANDPIMGLTKEERDEATKVLYADHETWEKKLNKNEHSTVLDYGMGHYEIMNRKLRGKGLTNYLKENSFYEKYVEERLDDEVGHLDSAISKAVIPEEPRKLYRYFKVPVGVDTQTYVEKYFTSGKGYRDKGFISTTMDPEFVMAHLMAEKAGGKGDDYVIFEILSKQGASMQAEPYGRSGDIQSLEKEIILPRDIKFRIGDIRKNQRFAFGSARPELEKQHSASLNKIKSKKMDVGTTMRFPIIQLIDEELISPTVATPPVEPTKHETMKNFILGKTSKIRFRKDK
jgi:hypothetical protein